MIYDNKLVSSKLLYSCALLRGACTREWDGEWWLGCDALSSVGGMPYQGFGARGDPLLINGAG
jgi:hypothetical protein